MMGSRGLKGAVEHCRCCEGCVFENYRMSWTVEWVRDEEVLVAKE
jgi:hypothetical protein